MLNNTENNLTLSNFDSFKQHFLTVCLNGDLITKEFTKITLFDIRVGSSYREFLKDRFNNLKTFEEKNEYFIQDIFSIVQSPIFKLYSEAYQAYHWISMNPEKSARVNIFEHARELINDLEEIPVEDHSWFTEKYVSLYRSYLGAKSRTASPMVTGPARFPTRRNEKALNSERNRYDELQNFRVNAKRKIKYRIEANKPQEVKDAESWENLKNELIESIQTIINIDLHNLPYHRSAFVNSIVGKIERLANNRKFDLVKKSLELIEEFNKLHKKPIITSRHKIWKLSELIVDQEGQDLQEDKTVEFSEGTVTINHTADRIQIHHNEKPSQDVIQELKRNAFKWSPTNKCWQRKTTPNAIRATENLLKIKF